MENIYLEKIANALTRAISRGAVTSVSTTARDGSKLGASKLNTILTGKTQAAAVHTPSSRLVVTGQDQRIIRNAATPARSVNTTDALARSGTAKDRLAVRKREQAQGRVYAKPTKTVFGNEIHGRSKKTGPSNQYLEKAKTFVSENKRALGATAGVGAVGYAMTRKNNQQEYGY